MSLSTITIGQFVDSKAGKSRSPSAVAGRLIEEVVELGLAAGLTAAEIMGHVADSLHNQALKASVESRTMFPSQLKGNVGELSEECADVQIVLKDLCYVANVNLADAEENKWNLFTKKQFHVSDSGTLYAIKPHVR